MPESYVGGQYFYDAISSTSEKLTNSIANSIDYYRKRHEKVMVEDEFMRDFAAQHPDDKHIQEAFKRYHETYSAPQKLAIAEGFQLSQQFGSELGKLDLQDKYKQAEIDRLNRENTLAKMAGKPVIQNGQKVGVYKPDGTVEFDPAWMHPKEKEEPKPLPPPPPQKGVIQRAHDWLLGEQPQQPQAQQSAIAQSPQQLALREKAIGILRKNNKPLTEANIQWVIKQMGGGSAQ
jgi:hypothetical protein